MFKTKYFWAWLDWRTRYLSNDLSEIKGFNLLIQLIKNSARHGQYKQLTNNLIDNINGIICFLLSRRFAYFTLYQPFLSQKSKGNCLPFLSLQKVVPSKNLLRFPAKVVVPNHCFPNLEMETKSRFLTKRMGMQVASTCFGPKGMGPNLSHANPKRRM